MASGTHRQTRFVINPRFRLRFPLFAVNWHEVDEAMLRHEAQRLAPSPGIYLSGSTVMVAVPTAQNDTLDLYYGADTHFDNVRLQRWLRTTIRDAITHRANEVLPARTRELANKHGLSVRAVTIRKLPRRILGQCDSLQRISLSPMLVVFPTDFMDDTILHELAHTRHMHHRKAFWTLLTQLLGTDAREQKRLMDIVLCKYLEYYQFLMR